MSKKVFLSYAHTGEDIEQVTQRMTTLRDLLEKRGIEAYCNLFDSDTDGFTSPREFIENALEKLKRYDVLFVINTSERRSEGILIEIGAAISLGKEIVVAQHESSVGKTYMPELAKQHFVWQNDAELFDKTKAAFSA